ncbi:MAG: class I SAM-dependent methyltransferase, partial [Bdellovibrionales bacterium]|nr:class I SAM-dependent methyltransferase [Bdellovibrionales bacterium]
RLSMRLVFKLLEQLKDGELKFVFPDGSSRLFGTPSPNGSQQCTPVELTVKHYRLFPKLLFGSEVAAGESYVDGDWTTTDLPELLKLFARNKKYLNLRTVKIGVLARAVDRFLHLLRRNTKGGSKRNISAHYDLSNEMFSLFLDNSMTYSCAIFDTEDSSLEEAQERKLSEVLRLGGVEPGQRILEIGCGWGSFAVKAAKEFGCHVTCLTLSEEQAEFARERVKAAGVENLVDIQLTDYRDIKGQFDRVVSIEMIEAVGEEYLEEYFRVCERLLNPGGRVIIQAITLKHERMELYRRSCDWIQKHIFPGCFVPSYEILREKVKNATSLVWKEEQAIGQHYATTLSLWGKRFLAKAPAVQSLGFSDEFIRKWIYYFGYCEAGFDTGELNTYQLVLEKPALEKSGRVS